MLNIPEYKDAERVFHYFEEISHIPHASTNTKLIADYLVEFARTHGLRYTRDAADNVIIRKPATPGYEDKPTVIFQGHTDMVADKIAGCNIDMEKDGLEIYRDGDYIKARGTTLGGDDGVAVAYALALLESSDIEHPEFEALFTSDEEIGLIGAAALDASVLKGKLMVNIDSDEEGVFTVGCAGGVRVDIDLDFQRESTPSQNLYRISVSGLVGGHSGTEIDKNRANAIKVLSDIIGNANDIKLVDICGGNADNAIPRFVECTVAIEDATFIEKKLIPATIERYKETEPDIKIGFEKLSESALAITSTDSAKIFNLIKKMPTGVYKMSVDIPGLPETSSNLGIIKSEASRVKLSISVRSSKNSEKIVLCEKIRDISGEYGASVSERGAYPAWEYKKGSKLCELMRRVYLDMYSEEPKIVTIHAGLECGIFSEKIPGLECVSIGPNNRDIHTPDERLSISSTARVWEYLKRVLKEI